MKKICILSLILALACILPAEVYSSAPESTTVCLKKRPKYKDSPTKDHRSPSLQIACFIDFTSNQITVQTSSPVVSYELWDEEGETMMAGYQTDSEMVEFMSGLEGIYHLQLATDDYIYVGCIEL